MMEGFEFCNGGDDVEVTQENVSELAGSLIDGVFSGARAIDDRERNFQKCKTRDEYMRILKDPNSVLIRDGERIVGVVSIDVRAEKFKGRKIIEINNLTVLPAYRKRHLFSGMIPCVRELIEKKHPRAVVIARSRDKGVQSVCLASGLREVDINRLRFALGDPLLSDDALLKWSQNGWMVFVSDKDLISVADLVSDVSLEVRKAMERDLKP